jgi:hypothetical protein
MLDNDLLHPVGSLAHWAFLHVLVLRCPSGAATGSQVCWKAVIARSGRDDAIQ